MSRLLTIWNHIRRHKYLITVVAFLVVIVFLDENISLDEMIYDTDEIGGIDE